MHLLLMAKDSLRLTMVLQFPVQSIFSWGDIFSMTHPAEHRKTTRGNFAKFLMLACDKILYVPMLRRSSAFIMLQEIYRLISKKVGFLYGFARRTLHSLRGGSKFEK